MYSRIVAGTDGSPTATRALEHALELARRCDAELHVVSVCPPVPALAGWEEEAQQATRDLVRSIEGRLGGQGVRVAAHAESGDPAARILAVADQVDADLIVVGNRGMTGARRFLGSVPNTISHKAHCSVLVVRTV